MTESGTKGPPRRPPHLYSPGEQVLNLKPLLAKIQRKSILRLVNKNVRDAVDATITAVYIHFGGGESNDGWSWRWDQHPDSNDKQIYAQLDRLLDAQLWQPIGNTYSLQSLVEALIHTLNHKWTSVAHLYLSTYMFELDANLTSQLLSNSQHWVNVEHMQLVHNGEWSNPSALVDGRYPGAVLALEAMQATTFLNIRHFEAADAVWNARIDAPYLAKISWLSQLHKIGLRGVELTEPQFLAIVKVCKNLRELRFLSSSPALTMAEAEAIESLTHLTRLDLHNKSVESEVVKSWPSNLWPGMKYLSCSDLKAAESWPHFATAMWNWHGHTLSFETMNFVLPASYNMSRVHWFKEAVDLRFEEVFMGDDGVQLFAAAGLDAITALDLSEGFTPLTNKDSTAMITSFPNLARLRIFSLLPEAYPVLAQHTWSKLREIDVPFHEVDSMVTLMKGDFRRLRCLTLSLQADNSRDDMDRLLQWSWQCYGLLPWLKKLTVLRYGRKFEEATIDVLVSILHGQPPIQA